MPRTKAKMLRVAVAATVMSGTGMAPGQARTTAPTYNVKCGRIPDLAAGAKVCTYTFEHRAHIATFIVPPTTEPIQITAVGAPGYGEDTVRSRGAKVTGSFSVPSGTPLFVVVGGDGYYDGYNGGVDGGGGASDVRQGRPDLAHRIIVAGGGGGAGEQLVFDEERGFWRFVVVKGGDAGEPGLAGGGQPGTATAGGAGGGTEPARGQPGTLGRGGHGANRGGGGGGGGLYGGGGGGGCWGGHDTHHFCTVSKPGSGGGGSSLVPEGGTFALSDVLEPLVTITVIQYG